MRIPVINGDLQGALKRWQRVAQDNRSALSRRRFYVGPAEAKRLKARKARQRVIRRRRND